MIVHSHPTISSKDIQAVHAALRSHQLSQGKLVNTFEKNFSKYLGVKGAIATNTGTAALHLALLALGIGKGDSVILPSFVCAALLNAVLYTQAKPILVDVEEQTFNLSVEDVQKKVSSTTKAIIVPHMFGHPADLSSLKKIGLPIIEDCAQSVGAGHKGKKVGTLGDIAVFSFYATKVMTTAEGGMVVSSRSSTLNKAKDLREYDKKKDYKIRFNYKMSDIQAALGISQLSQLPVWIKRRRAIAKFYTTSFSKSAIQCPIEKKGDRHIYYRYIIKVPKNRDRLMKKLQASGIQCGVPVHTPLHACLKKKNYPTTDRLMRQTLSIPIYPTLTQKQRQFIVDRVTRVQLASATHCDRKTS